MTPVIYNIPAALAPAYRGRSVIVRARDPGALHAPLSATEPEDLIGIQLLDLEADAAALGGWDFPVPIELVMDDPAKEFPLLYRHAKLLDKHPVRVSIPPAPGCKQAVRVAASLNFVVRLEPGQPTGEEVEELSAVLDLYLHGTLVTQPVEPFHGTLLSFYHREPVTLWEILEQHPALVRYVGDDGTEGLARPSAAGFRGDARDFQSLASAPASGLASSPRSGMASGLAAFEAEVTAPGTECSGCEYFPHCGGYFKWPRRDYDCAGVRKLFGALEAAAGELRRDLAAFDAAEVEAVR